MADITVSLGIDSRQLKTGADAAFKTLDKLELSIRKTQKSFNDFNKTLRSAGSNLNKLLRSSGGQLNKNFTTFNSTTQKSIQNVNKLDSSLAKLNATARKTSAQMNAVGGSVNKARKATQDSTAGFGAFTKSAAGTAAGFGKLNNFIKTFIASAIVIKGVRLAGE